MDEMCYTLTAFKFWYKDKIRVVTIQVSTVVTLHTSQLYTLWDPILYAH